MGAGGAYWTDYSFGRDGMFVVPLAGGAAARLPSGSNLAQGIAVDATSIHWTTYEGAVMTLSLN